MNIIKTLCLTLAITLFAVPSAFAAFAGGSGTPADPYQIADVDQLQEVKDYPSSHFILINDIDASITQTWNSGAGFETIFLTGTFDGQGYEVTGLYINRPKDSVGLFGRTDTDAEISNVGVVNADVTGIDDVGILVGRHYGTVINCFSSGNVYGQQYVGGLVGECLTDSVITNSYSAGSIMGGNYVGGLVGYHYGGTVTSCYSASHVIGDYSCGGLVGYILVGTVINCFSTGNIKCYSWCSGGFAGINEGTIENCYSTGSVDGKDPAGFVGWNYDGTITNSFWNTETSGLTVSDGGTGKTTSEMLQQATFTGWDFSSVWDINENTCYPFLRSLGNSHIHIDVFPVSGLKTAEDGDTDEFAVRLGSVPADNVTVDIYSSDTSEGVVSPSSLTITPANWFAEQKVNVTGLDDAISDGKQLYTIVLSPAVSSDSDYNGMNPDDVSVTNYEIIEIYDVNDLQNMNHDLDAYYVLAGDIDASATQAWNSGAGFDPVGDDTAPFTGVFNGRDYEISGLYINRPSENNVGLFGYSGAGAEISNIFNVNADVTGASYVGSMVGCNYVGVIKNIRTAGNVTSAVSMDCLTGGLVGCNEYGLVDNCSSTGNVSGGSTVGGLVGMNFEGTVKNSHSTCAISWGGGLIGNNDLGIVENCYYQGNEIPIAGLIGADEYGTIRNCYSSANITVNTDVGAGGLVAYTTGTTITNCYTSGSVSSSGSVAGGLVGEAQSSTITKCYSTANVNSNSGSAGGLIGDNWGTDILNCYSSGNVIGEWGVGGLKRI